MSPSPLTSIQQRIVRALAAGATLTAAASENGVHRVTIYRWMKNHREFQDALRRARANFILSRRDQLYDLSTGALYALHNILANPKSSPAVLLRTAMFILNRPTAPKTGWTMPEPAPLPDSGEILDSSQIEAAFTQFPELCGAEEDATPAALSAAAAEALAESPEIPIESQESDASESLAEPEGAPEKLAEPATMQHVSPVSEDVAPPAQTQFERLKARYLREKDLDPGVVAMEKALAKFCVEAERC